jgi:oxygen-dependent protoporphyrinogen oxidase
MSSLVNAIVARLPEGSIQYDTQVDQIERDADGGWTLKARQQGQPVTLQADAVIVATPAQAASRVVRTIHPRLSSDLAKINSTSCAIVSLGYRREQVGRHLDGFGFVVPLVENREILSGSFSSVKFVGRAPEGFVLIRTFLGGAFDPQALDRDDDSLTASAVRELSALLGVKGQPVVKRISRWPNVMPQYELGHLDLVRSIESAVEHELVGIAIAGNAYHGVGVPQCIQSGEAAASRVASYLRASGTEKNLTSAAETS